MESKYTVQLTVTDPTVTEIFYFCHIHDAMSGRYDVGCMHVIEREVDSNRYI